MVPGIGFSLQKKYDIPLEQVIVMLRKHGFTAVSPLWTPELDLAAVSSCVKANSMMIQSLHATYSGIALLWEPENEKSAVSLSNIVRSIDDCARFEIPTLVVHSWQGLIYSFPEEPLDFRRFDELVLYAEKRGVSIAFENLEGEEYLEALMLRYETQRNVGYCWDSGHENCYPHKIDFLNRFGNRLIMTHLNDNFGLRSPDGTPTGDDDLHLIPYDGAIDWDKAIAKLRSAASQHILNFELKTISHSTAEEDLIYAELPLERFIAKSAEKARVIAEKYAGRDELP